MNTHEPISILRTRIRTLTFDCYGTLVDWKLGLANSFRAMFGPMVDARIDELFAHYVDQEAELEAGSFRKYREVLTEVAVRMGDFLKRPIARREAERLAEMLPHWTLFADTNAALRRLATRYRLGVLSNIDRDLFAGTARQVDVEFDFVVTAEDVGSYKPAHGHFLRAFERHVDRASMLHVGQSLFHDARPTHELGVPFVWINRYAQSGDASLRPVGEYPDLQSFAAAMDSG